MDTNTNTTMSTNTLVIYHKGCADGFAAAYAAWLSLGAENVTYLPMHYNDTTWDHTCVEGREVCILDFSFPRPIMDAIFKLARRVIWLDHHKTAFEMWGTGMDTRHVDHGYDDLHNRWITLDNNMSGAALAWEFFHEHKPVPMLIQHVDDYDRWQFKIEGTKAFIKSLWAQAPWSFEQWHEWGFDVEGKSGYYWEFVHSGEAMLKAHDQNVQSVIHGTMRRVYIPSDEYVTGFFDTTTNGLSSNCPLHLTSDVGQDLAKRSGTFGLCWMVNKDGKCIVGLRSIGDYDVSAIAKRFGGGGHQNAAGFEIPIETLIGWHK